MESMDIKNRLVTGDFYGGRMAESSILRPLGE